MAVLKYKDSNGDYQPLVGINVQCEVVQTTGQSTTTVMSQKAVTDELGGKSDKADTVSDISFDSSTNKLKKTIDGTTSDVCEILKKDGFYEDLHSGLADNLFGETQTSDRFLFRPTAGIQDIESGEPPVGGAAVRRIEGSAVAWNQLIPSSGGDYSGHGITMTRNADGSMTVNGTAEEYSFNLFGYIHFVAGHKYLEIYGKEAIEGVRICPYASSTGGSYGFGIFECLETVVSGVGIFVYEDTTLSNVVLYPILIDLTLLFGAGNEPETVAAFEQWLSENIGLKSYYPYNAGELIPVKDYKVKSVGFNVWDEQWEAGTINGGNGSNVDGDFLNTRIRSKNYCHCLGGTKYYLDFVGNTYTNTFVRVFWYDESKNYLGASDGYGVSDTSPSNARFFRISTEGLSYGNTYNNDICINLSYDDDKDGTYEEHWEHETAVDVTTLKGKLNGTGSSVVVFPDGLKKAGSVYDEIVRTGGVTKAIKRVGSVDLGTLDYVYDSVNQVFYISIPEYAMTLNFVCALFVNAGQMPFNSNDNNCIKVWEGNYYTFYIRCTAYSDVATFTTAMSGVMLYYELATPQEYILDDDILPMQYAVDDYGTEELLLGNDSSVVSCTPKMSIKYGINAADTIASLPHSYVSSKHQSLNDSEQETARQNIGAASQHDMTVVKKQIELIDKKVENDYYVDMGLPSGVLWAKRNIFTGTGNDMGFAPSEYSYDASFFSWGNKEAHNPISTTAFDYDFGSTNSGPYASTDGAKLTGNIPLSQDAARENCGEPWRMPTNAEFAELFANCDFVDANGAIIASTTVNKLITMSGYVGIRLKSKINGKILFFPCTGFSNNTTWNSRAADGRYWSSSLYDETQGRYLFFGSGGVNPQYYVNRYLGCAIRPVM